MLQFFYGDDDFAIQQAETTAISFLGIDDFDTSYYDGDDNDRVLSDLQTPPFFSSHRLVVWRNPDLRRHADTLLSALDFADNAVFIVSVSRKPDKRLKAFKALKKAALVEREFQLPPPWRTDLIADRIRDVTKAKGLAITHDAIEALADEFGNDLFRIVSELEKLTNAYGNIQIDGDLIRRAINAENTTVFALVDALLDRDVPKSVEISAKLRNEPSMLILSILTREFHTYLSLKVGIIPLGISPQRQRFLNARLRGVDGRYLQSAIERSLAAQSEVKHGNFDLDLFVIDLIHAQI